MLYLVGLGLKWCKDLISTRNKYINLINILRLLFYLTADGVISTPNHLMLSFLRVPS